MFILMALRRAFSLGSGHASRRALEGVSTRTPEPARQACWAIHGFGVIGQQLVQVLRPFTSEHLRVFAARSRQNFFPAWTSSGRNRWKNCLAPQTSWSNWQP